MQLTRRIPGHFRTDEPNLTWLADVVLDLSALPAGTLPVTFTAIVSVPDFGHFALTTGGVLRSVGTATAAEYDASGAFVGQVNGASVDGVAQDAGPVVMHLVAQHNEESTADVDISSVVITVGTP